MNFKKAKKMTLDFTAIDNIPFTGKTEPTTEKDSEASVSLEREKQKRHDIKKAGMMRGDLLKGIKAGEDPLSLLLKAMEIISLITGDKTFYSQSTEDIKIIYGWGLGETTPLKKELADAKQRLEKLKQTSSTIQPEEKHRIQEAIKAHEELITMLEDKLKDLTP